MGPFRILFVDEIRRLNIKHKHSLHSNQIVLELLTLEFGHRRVDFVDLKSAHRIRVIPIAIRDIFELVSLTQVLLIFVNLKRNGDRTNDKRSRLNFD